MENNSYDISLGDFHYILSLFWNYEQNLELKNVKITQDGYSFSLIQLNRLYTQMNSLYLKLTKDGVTRESDLLANYIRNILAKIVQKNKEIAQFRASK